MSKIYELSLTLMHLNRNLNTPFYAVITVSYEKEYLKVFMKINFFWYFQHGEKREKCVGGHESDKLIESYSAQPATVPVIFHYQAIYKFNSCKFRQVQPVLTDGPHYFFFLFFQ